MYKTIKKFISAVIAIAVTASGFAFAAAPDKSSRYTWNNVNMGCYGFVTGMVVHPKNPDLMYVHTDVGGMYKYDKQNNRWIQLMESIAEKDKGLSSVRSVALDPNDENIIYAACGGSSGTTDIIKSTDGGKTWNRTYFSDKFFADGKPLFCGNTRVARAIGQSLVVDPINSDIIFFGTQKNGFYRSEDGGTNWVKVADIPDTGWPTGGVAAVYVDPERQSDGRSTDVYVSSWGHGVYKSTDGGASFSLIEGSPRVPCRVQVVHGDTDKIYVSSYNPNLTDYYTGVDDTGKVETDEAGSFWLYENGAWRDLHPYGKDKNSSNYKYFAQYTSFSSFMIDRRNPNVILLNSAPWSVKNFYIFLSTDGGENFTRISQSYQATELWQSADNPDAVWMPFGGGVVYISDFKTLKDRNNFVRKDDGIETICVTKMASLPSDEAPLLLIESQDHSLRVQEDLSVRAPDNAVAPTFNHGGGIDFCEGDPSFVLRTGVKGRHNFGTGTVAYSTDYGRTYTAVTGWDETMRIVDCAVGAEKQENGFPVMFVLSVGRTDESDPENANASGYGEGRGLYRSADGGATWTKAVGVNVTRKKAANDYNNHIVASDRVDPNIFYYVEKNKLFRTTDGGKNWKIVDPVTDSDGNKIEIPEYGAAIKCVPGVRGGVWIKSTNGKIYTSYDSGQTFRLLDSITDADSSGCCFGFGVGEVGSGTAVYVIGYVDGVFGMYISNDLGASWIKISPDGQNFFAGVVEVCGDRRQYGRVFVGTGGTGVIYGEGNPLQTVENYTDGEKLTVSASAYNTAASDKNLTVFAAFYAEGGELMNVQMQKFAVGSGTGENDYNFEITVPQNSENSILKVFAFDDSLAPLHTIFEMPQKVRD